MLLLEDTPGICLKEYHARNTTQADSLVEAGTPHDSGPSLIPGAGLTAQRPDERPLFRSGAA